MSAPPDSAHLSLFQVERKLGGETAYNLSPLPARPSMMWRRPSRVKVGIGVRVDGVDDLTVFRVELAQSQDRPRGSGFDQTVGQFLIHYRYPQGASGRILPGRFLARLSKFSSPRTIFCACCQLQG